jgi:hypothetical protein
MKTYNLYLDESGSFRDRHRRSLVCGVLEDRAAQIDWNEIRTEVQRVLPLVPYPFHATLLHEPALWPALALLEARRPKARRSSEGAELLDQMRPISKLVHGASRVDRKPIEQLLQSIDRGRVPEKLELQAFHDWLLERSSASARKLEMLRYRTRRALQSTYRQRLAQHRGSLVAVAAVADAKAPAPPPQPGERLEFSESGKRPGGYTSQRNTSVRRDAYVRALETVLERVLCMLRGSDPCQLNLWVASRHVDLKGYGTLDLSRDAVREIAELAARFPELPVGERGEQGVDVDVNLPRGVVRFDGSAPMGLVLADYVSNQLYHELRSREVELSDLSDGLQRRAGLRLEAGPRHPLATSVLPTIAWDGPARATLRKAFAGQSANTSTLEPRANRTQAECWELFTREAKGMISA